MNLPPRQLIDDCFLHDKDRLRHQEAVDLLNSRLGVIVGSNELDLSKASGRILADDIIAPQNVPLHNNAAVDGYAFCMADYATNEGRFPISARIAAGDLSPEPLAKNSAARIFTGATMPKGADSVVMQEDCVIDDVDGKSYVSIPDGLKPGANWRKAGEDVKSGEKILTVGQKLRPQDIAAIASTGQARIKVWNKLRVALISTGNELLRPGTKIARGQIYDSNHFLLSALLQASCVEITDYGIIADNKEAIAGALLNAASNNDVILTTGGASRGEEDHITTVLDEIGRRHMWQMAIKPGRPMMFGQISTGDNPGDNPDKNDCLFFGLPGNPVAVMVCFLMYAQPSLAMLSGGKWKDPVRYPIPADFEIKNKKPDRREFLRGQLVKSDDGNLTVSKYQHDGSGMISSLRQAGGLIEIEENKTSVQVGEFVNFIPFSEFGIV